MEYEVVIDGFGSTGMPSGQIPMSVSGLTGDHSVIIITQHLASGDDATLLFVESAVVTVKLTG